MIPEDSNILAALDLLKSGERPLVILGKLVYILSVPKFIAHLYCICLSINLRNTYANAVQICGKFWDIQYIYIYYIYIYINKLKSYKLCLLWKTLIMKSIDQVE